MPSLYEELEMVSKILHITKVEWLRNILAHEIKRELEQHKAYISLEYLKGNISKRELKRFLAKKEADDVDYIKRKTKEDLEASISLTRHR